MGNDIKTVRSKINNLTVLCENLWPILYYLGGPLLALSSGSSRMYRKSTDKLLCEVCSLSLFYGLKLQLILLLTVLLSLPINDLPQKMSLIFFFIQRLWRSGRQSKSTLPWSWMTMRHFRKMIIVSDSFDTFPARL